MSVTLKCQWCDKEFEAQRSTAKFCCDAHKMNFARKEKIDTALTNKSLPPTIQASKLPSPPPKTEPQPEAVKTHLTPVDLEYQEYYEGETGKPVVFQEKRATRKCVICKKEFKTHLEALRFCSMTCREYFTTGDGVLSS